MKHYEKQLTPTHCTYRFSPFPPESGRNITDFSKPSACFFFHHCFFWGKTAQFSALLPGKPVSPPHAPKPGPKPQHLQRPVSPVKAPSKPPATLAMAKTPAKTPAKTAPEKGQKRLCGVRTWQKVEILRSLHRFGGV